MIISCEKLDNESLEKTTPFIASRDDFVKLFSIKTLQFEIGQIAHFCLVEKGKHFSDNRRCCSTSVLFNVSSFD